MAECPKCKEHLKMTDWKQHCPHCGANVVIYDIQERLMKDADIAEVQYYHFQKKIDRLKASFVGSRLAVIRIFTSLIPILAIVVPFFKCEFKAPFAEFNGFLSLFSLLDIIENLNVDNILGLLNTADGKIPLILFGVPIVLLVLSIVLLLVRFGCLTMACSKKGKAICYGFDITLVLLTVIATVMFFVIPDNPYFSIGFVLAPFVYLILLGVNFYVDILIFKKGIEVKHAPCFVGGIPIEEYFKMLEDGIPQEEIRAEMYKRLAKLQEEKEAELNEKEGAKA
ncbi:MAG: hypothetical protein E7522_06465 [Ruminococcaceae bacterium]|nr:hypothetical protein [Oscillospiraceae bacterium]